MREDVSWIHVIVSSGIGNELDASNSMTKTSRPRYQGALHGCLQIILDATARRQLCHERSEDACFLQQPLSGWTCLCMCKECQLDSALCDLTGEAHVLFPFLSYERSVVATHFTNTVKCALAP